jgi:hypothetical protein
VSHVTNRIGVEALHDLLERKRVGVLAHVDASGAIQAFPVAFRWHEGRFWVGSRSRALPSGARVALAVDEGWFWWELRAVLARGVLTPSGRPGGSGASNVAWFELATDRVTGWDYGTLREET